MNGQIDGLELGTSERSRHDIYENLNMKQSIRLSVNYHATRKQADDCFYPISSSPASELPNECLMN